MIAAIAFRSDFSPKVPGQQTAVLVVGRMILRRILTVDVCTDGNVESAVLLNPHTKFSEKVNKINFFQDLHDSSNRFMSRALIVLF